MTPANQDVARVLYEALKRFVHEEESAAFERWLQTTCPSGDVESVQRQWEESFALQDLIVEPLIAEANSAMALYEASITEPLESDSPVEKLRVAGL